MKLLRATNLLQPIDPYKVVATMLTRLRAKRQTAYILGYVSK